MEPGGDKENVEKWGDLINTLDVNEDIENAKEKNSKDNTVIL